MLNLSASAKKLRTDEKAHRKKRFWVQSSAEVYFFISCTPMSPNEALNNAIGHSHHLRRCWKAPTNTEQMTFTMSSYYNSFAYKLWSVLSVNEQSPKRHSHFPLKPSYKPSSHLCACFYLSRISARVSWLWQNVLLVDKSRRGCTKFLQ